MSVYNGGRHLEAAVNSVLGQTFSDFEFIIIDDGSRDGSAAKLAGFAERDSRIRLVARENRGLTVSLNEGLALARADLIARMDADDVADAQRLDRQVERMRQDASLVALGTWAQCIEDTGLPVFQWRTPATHEGIDGAHIRGETGNIIHPTAMMRREAVAKVGGYNAKYETAQDLDLWLRLAEMGRLSNLPELLLKYRLTLQAVTQAKRRRQEADATEAIRSARERRGLPPITREIDDRFLSSAPEILLDRWIIAAVSERHFHTAGVLALRLIRLKPISPASWRRALAVLWRQFHARRLVSK